MMELTIISLFILAIWYALGFLTLIAVRQVLKDEGINVNFTTRKKVIMARVAVVSLWPLVVVGYALYVAYCVVAYEEDKL